jgi:putative transposase
MDYIWHWEIVADERQHAYRELFLYVLGPEQVHDIRATVQTGTPLGNDRFRGQIENALNCQVGQARRGRPSRDIAKGY